MRQGKTPTWWPMEGPKLGGQWKVPSLVTFGMFHAWWPMEGSKLGGLQKEKERHPSHLFSLSPATNFI